MTISPAAIDDLLSRIDLAEVAERLGATLGRRRVGACPICGGGKGAGRFEIKDGGRAWVCAVCADGGDAIALVRRCKGLSFPEAVAWLGGARPVDPAEEARRAAERAERQAQRERQAARYREQERKRLYQVWRAAQRFEGTPVEAYLRGRGIDWLEDLTLRYAPAMPYFEGETKDERGRGSPRVVYSGPAMLAPFVDDGFTFRGLHITWLDAERPGSKAAIFDPQTGEALTAKKMRGSKAGMFIPLSRSGDPKRLRAGEGIETMLSVRDGLRDGGCYRAAGDLGNLGGPAMETLAHSTLKHANGHRMRLPGPVPDFSRPAMPIPAEAEEAWWFADGDSERELTAFAMRRAAARHARPGLAQRIVWAPDGLDWNDVARSQTGSSERKPSSRSAQC